MMTCSDAAFSTVRAAFGVGHHPDVFDRMAADHKRLRFLMDQLCQSRDAGPDRRRLFDLLSDALEAYGAAAEQSLYAGILARAEEETAWPARHAVGVHDMVELLLFELSHMEIDGEDWRAGIGQLADYLEDHFRLEAEEIFPLARTLLDGEAAARLGKTYEQVRLKWIDSFGREPAVSQPKSVKHSKILDKVVWDLGLPQLSGHPH